MGQIKTLSSRVQGPVLVPGDEGYDTERSGFQTAWRHRPAVIVGAASASDVQAAVEFAAAHGMPVAIQATGQGLAAPCADGLLISTHRMVDVRVDPGLRAARLEAGARWADVVNATAPYGLAPLSGSSPLSGAVGHTLGGGVGILARRYGYTADHVRALDVVTADGRFRRVTADSEPDLFWALRGGGGNFGVVTAMEIDLIPVTRIYTGTLNFVPSVGVLEAYREWTATVPEEMNSSANARTFPDSPDVPEPVRGRHVASIRIAYYGDPETGNRLMAPLRTAGQPFMDSMAHRRFETTAFAYNEPTEPHGYYGTSAMLSGVDTTALQRVFDMTGTAFPLPCVVGLRHLGGALAEPPAIANAVGHRDAQYLFRITSPTEPAGIDAARSLQHRMVQALKPWHHGGRCLNFLYTNDATEYVGDVYEPAGYKRLAAIKAIYDPDNMFRFNHNIRPA